MILAVKNLYKQFGRFQVLKDVSFNVNQGDIFGFLGPNGAGKTTTIRIIADLIRADSGSAEIEGISTRKHKTRALKHTGMLIEDPAFYGHLSAEANLQIICRVSGIPAHTEIPRVLKITDLSDYASRKVRAYSRGMKQRLALAQAILGHPRLLILDEPTNGLDPVSMRSVRQLMMRLRNDGMTILLSSHLLYEVERICTRMAIISRGEIIRQGNVRQLLHESDDFTVEFRTGDDRLAMDILKTFCGTDKPELADSGILLRLPGKLVPDAAAEIVKHGIPLNAVIPRTNLEDYFIRLLEHDDASDTM